MLPNVGGFIWFGAFWRVILFLSQGIVQNEKQVQIA